MRFLRICFVIGFTVSFLACQKSEDVAFTDQRAPEEKLLAAPTQPPLELKNCVHVYYDKTPPEGWEPLGKLYAVQVLNLLGHFAEYQRHLSAVEDYVAGDINKCGVNIYLDTNYYSVVPESFLADFKSTTNQVAWIGENSYKLGADLKPMFGVNYNPTEPYTTLDRTDLVDNKPSFFKNVYYKGEMFTKYGEMGKAEPYLSDFFSAWEVSKLDYDATAVLDSTDHRIIAEIEHNYTKERRPWAIQSNNRFLVVEIPLSYVHAADRYFIFADMLFDILKAQPRHNSKPALVRLEDVHCETDLKALENARLIFKQNQIKPHLSIIPIYNNPLNANELYVGQAERPMTKNKAFMTKMQKYKADGAEFIWHGITHQLGKVLNPWESTSGSDYEFWDFSDDVLHNHPWPLVGRQVPGETSTSIVERFKKGGNVFRDANMSTQIWMTPHYHGSSLANYVFGQLFDWTVGRVVYYENTMSGIDLNTNASLLKLPSLTAASWLLRQLYLKPLKVTQLSTRQNGQLYPYEIYGDVYGQKVFPENLGNVEKELSAQVLETREVPQMLADAKRNLVLRDVWGSGFYHPYYLQDPYWTTSSNLTNNDLHQLLSGLKQLGYNFVGLEEKAKEFAARAKAVDYR